MRRWQRHTYPGNAPRLSRLRPNARNVRPSSAVLSALRRASARASVGSASCAADAEADREGNDPRKDEDTSKAMSVADGGKDDNPEAEQSKPGYKPKGDEALP